MHAVTLLQDRHHVQAVDTARNAASDKAFSRIGPQNDPLEGAKTLYLRTPWHGLVSVVDRSRNRSTGLRENYVGTRELRGSAREGQARSVWSIWLIWFVLFILLIWFIWLVSFNQ
jgi:hypothetical protein